MRRLLSVLAATCLAGSTTLAQTPASGKTASSWKCSAPNPVNAVPVGDEPNHMYVVEQMKCTATKGEIAGVQEKEGTGTEFAEVTGDTSKGHGVFVETLANGDKAFVSYTFTGTSKNNKMVSGSNKWTFTGGTGMLKGAKGGGTCKAKGDPDGSATFECSGTYTLAK
jgi:hypothetical protein